MGRHGSGSWDEITRGSRRYTRFRITIDGKTIERTGPSRRALEKTAEELRKRARQHLIGDDEEITLRDWALTRWLPAKADELGPAGAKTLRNYTSVLGKHILPLLGSVKVRDLRAEHRRRLQRTLKDAGLKVSTINKIDDTLRFCLQAAANDEVPVVVSVLTAVKHLKAQPEAKKGLAAEQVRQILLAARESAWLALWVCFAYTGARDAEVRALRWR
jgi:integrase